MKKYLLFLFAMLTGAIGAWGDLPQGLTVNDNGSSITVNSTSDGLIRANISDIKTKGYPTYRNFLKITGNINQSDIAALNEWTEFGSSQSNVMAIDFSGATIVGEGGYSANSIFKGIALPTDYDFSSYTGSQTFAYYTKDDNVYLHIYNSTNGISHFVSFSQSNSWSNAPANNKIIYLSGDYGDFETAKTALSSNAGAGARTVIRVTPVSNDPYTVDGCNITINLAKAEEGQTLADLIELAKAAMTKADASQTSICTLTVTGELSANDLTVALSNSDMASATRIDLSGATLASGVSLTSLNIPSSLTSLVLPKGQTVSVGLASKLTAATSLKYAYSPTSSSSRTVAEQFSPDYVYVKIPGSLSTAVSNEEGLRKGVYIKIATPSGVNLSNDDAKFGTMGIDVTDATNYGWQYVDMSDAGVTAEATLAATAPHNKGYRIILPDNLTGDHMAIFASNTNHGSVAALYSYTGTTLRILELTDDSYREDALRDPRIVIPGTDAIEVVTGTYNNTRYGLFGDFNNSTQNNLLAAINGADENIKTVILNNVWATTTNLTFTNTHIETLQIDGIHLHYSPTGGSNINVTSCTSLKTLNITNSVINSLDAHGIASLTGVNLNGTKNDGATNLSGSGLKTLTTNSSTEFVGDLDLKSTASFTSFATQAKVTGNIYLNASGVSTVDLQSVQFQNTSSKIHIHKTANEEDTKVLDALNADGQLTIYIPTGFDKDNRLHPYPMDGKTAVLADNIAELAATGSFEDTCDPKCRIDYDADTHIATVYAYTPGHFKALMEKDNNYGKFVDGAIFTFDASCKLNAEDLAALAGKDGYGNFNWNYVDLYNLPASYEDGGTTYTYDNIIKEAIGTLRTNNWQYKSLLLPSTSGLGTTLIQDRSEDATKLATCSESIAYSGNITGTTTRLTASYIYKAADDWGIDYQARLLNLEKMMDLHAEIVNTTQYYSVSTNSATPLDLSTLPLTATVGVNTVKTSKLETVNNNMVTGTATPSIYAYPAYVGVMSNVMGATGIGATPNLETLKVAGPLNATDIKSVNSFTDGPRVLDLSEAVVDGGITKAMLESITNSNIEYIILPPGMTKDVVCGANYTNGLKTNLKAVISSTATDLVAHVQQDGSLAMARYYATGGRYDVQTNLYTPNPTGLQSVTLSGNLNAADIAANTFDLKVNSSGHWYSEGANASNIALSSEQGTITSIDLRDAVFPVYTDMKLSYAGLSSLTDVKLPIASTMDKLPEDCLNNIETLKQLCIPSNYKVIEKNALFLCGALTIITDNDAHTLYIGKNGESFLTEADAFTASYDTYTLSKNITNIATGSFNTRSISLSDIYVMATTTPKCEKDAFAEGMYVGWKGFTGGDFPYCREKYRNGLHLYTILHYPAKSNTNLTDAAYEAMEKNYTDVTKIYTKKEQTGAKDANGREIVWPTFPELRRVFAQASDGLTWYDWPTAYTTDPQYAVNETVSLQAQYKDRQEADLSKTYDFNNYIGWHQFVLTMASNYQPSEEVVNNKIDRRYVDAGYYTFCIPFDMTLEEVIELMGVPASDNTYNNYLGDSETPVTESIVPEIYQLNLVTRKWANTSITNDKNVVKLILTENLYNATSKETCYLDFASSVEGGVINITKSLETLPDGVCLKGGRPYIIKAYKRQGKTIKSRNLGQFIMNEYGNKFKLAASCVHNCFEQLGGGSLTTLKFAKPYENHKVQAMMDSENGSPLTYTEDKKEKKYYYTMIGQFWTQKLPLYCIYMSGNNHWYRYDQYEEGYNWQAYKCVIMASKEGTDNTVAHYGGGYRQAEGDYTHYPTVKEGTTDQLDNSFKLGFLDGRDDDDFDTATKPVGTRYIFAFDDGIVELDEEGNEVTAIEELDGEIVAPLKDDNRVYNMQGQYVGQMNNSLGKGMYIVNGKKIVVK